MNIIWFIYFILPLFVSIIILFTIHFFSVNYFHYKHVLVSMVGWLWPEVLFGN